MRSQIVKNLINKIGSEVTVIAPNQSFTNQTTKAVIEPITSFSETYKKDKFSSLGGLDSNNYVYFGSSDVRLDTYPVNTKIVCNNETYIMKNSEKFSVSGEIIYVWAALQKYIEE